LAFAQIVEEAMNKSDLIAQLAEKLEIPKVRASDYVNGVFDLMQEHLASSTGDDPAKVTISDFGTFTVSTRRAFKGHNPKSGTSIEVPERRIPVFRAGKALKKSLNPE
jgi:nucleoid DNA-binding protein